MSKDSEMICVNSYHTDKHLTEQDQQEQREVWVEGHRDELSGKLVNGAKVRLSGGNYIDYSEVTDNLGEEFWSYLQSFHGSLEGGTVRFIAAEMMMNELGKALKVAVDDNLEAYAELQAERSI